MRPFWGLGATHAVRLRLIGKLIGDFLLVIIELFSLGAFVLSQSTRLSGGQTDRQKVNHNTVCMLRSRTVNNTIKLEQMNRTAKHIDSGSYKITVSYVKCIVYAVQINEMCTKCNEQIPTDQISAANRSIRRT